MMGEIITTLTLARVHLQLLSVGSKGYNGILNLCLSLSIEDLDLGWGLRYTVSIYLQNLRERMRTL